MRISKKSCLHKPTLKLLLVGFLVLFLLVVVPAGIGFHHGYLLGKLMKVAVLIGSWCFLSYQAADNELCHTVISGWFTISLIPLGKAPVDFFRRSFSVSYLSK